MMCEFWSEFHRHDWRQWKTSDWTGWWWGWYHLPPRPVDLSCTLEVISITNIPQHALKERSQCWSDYMSSDWNRMLLFLYCDVNEQKQLRMTCSGLKSIKYLYVCPELQVTGSISFEHQLHTLEKTSQALQHCRISHFNDRSQRVTTVHFHLKIYMYFSRCH